jgi:aminoacyl tRNA synthetase class II, N-terminal domain
VNAKMLDREIELAKLNNIDILEKLEAWYQAILGKKGILSEQLKTLATMSPEEKKEKG